MSRAEHNRAAEGKREVKGAKGAEKRGDRQRRIERLSAAQISCFVFIPAFFGQ